MGDLWIDPTDPGFLIKKFKTPLNAHESKLLIDLNSLLYDIRPSSKETLEQNFAWPIEVFGTERSITAIKIPFALPNYSREIEVLNNKTNSLMDLVYLVDKDWWLSPAVNSKEPDISLEQRIEFCHNLITTLLALWESGAIYGDFSYKNLIWALTPTPRIMFLDADTATADNSYDRKLHSPFWAEHLLPNLTPSQKDFRLASLAVWRILGQNIRIHPDDPNYLNGLNTVGSDLRVAIKDLWNGMKLDSAYELQKVLHTYRSDEYISELLRTSKQQGFARHSLLHIPHNPSRAETTFIEQASFWLQIEKEFENKRGRAQIRFGRLNGNNPDFVFDVISAPTSVDITRPENFWNAFRDGEFELIAENKDRFEMSSPLIPFVTRAIEHALVEIQTPSVIFTTTQSTFEARWTFPAAVNWVNHAMMTVRDASGTVLAQQIFRRKPTRSGVNLPRDPNIASIEIGWVVENADGLRVMAPSVWLENIAQGTTPRTIQPPIQNDRPRISVSEQLYDTRPVPDRRAVPPAPAQAPAQAPAPAPAQAPAPAPAPAPRGSLGRLVSQFKSRIFRR